MLKTTVETQSENHYQVFQENAIPGSHQSPRTMPTFHIPIIGTSPCKDGNVFEPAKIDPKDAIKKFSISRKDATLLPKLQYEEVNKVHLENVKTIDLCSSGYDFSKYHNGKPFEKKVFLPKITFETSFEREVPSQSTSFQFFQNKDFESQNRDSFSSDATICQNSNGYKFHPSFQDFLNKEGKQFGIPVFKEIGNDQDKGGGIINEKLRPKLKPSTFGNGNFQLVKTPTPTVNPLNHFASYVSLVGNDEKFFEKLGSNDELSMIQQNFLIEVERLKHITGKIQNFIDNEFLKEFEKDNGRNSMFLNLEKDQLLQKLKNITGVLPLDIQSQDSTKFFLKNSEKDKIQLTINSLQEIQVSLESWFPQAFTDEVQELETNDVFDDSDGTVDISSTDNEREIIYHASTSASDDGFVSSNDGQNTGKKEEEEETQKKNLLVKFLVKKAKKNLQCLLWLVQIFLNFWENQN
ncbi:hypothetical protein PACTADRAFT_79048 [Pachysolen tannophilus NRRL Y-2460]|uniref:Uncharacterized protein n=1 Tax=Pachysolen tannophilus NRRL Y-2460 TaxID=669874 RepID=A0A1E4TXY7_PACTA|nr:hypothetical protein PACTADRAFT_79048 [Pachysolen tannophilus NRRL Y-2460]